MTTEPRTWLTRVCHVLKLNRSSFYKRVNTREKRRLKKYSDGLIGIKIKSIFNDEHGLYGAKRIAASLNDDADLTPINHKKVARIIKGHGTKRLEHTASMHHHQAQAWPPFHARFSGTHIHS